MKNTETTLHLLENEDEIRELTALIDRCAEQAMSEYRDEPLPPRVAERFLERALGAPQTVVLVAEEDPGDAPGREPAGLCLVGPFADPLTGEVVPMICLLHVRGDVRHRGLARRMVEAARRVLRERGETRLAARAAHNDDALVSMGERWGFTRQWELMLYE